MWLDGPGNVDGLLGTINRGDGQMELGRQCETSPAAAEGQAQQRPVQKAETCIGGIRSKKPPDVATDRRTEIARG
ncbi:chromosome 7 SCAF14536 whole genome shotgun sequence [Pseudomonas sp. MT-1]|nr:chromosome 7 SCAF14536 whole genome shotgun sequence [Pseudomonas sp. MT-1]